jgi:enamine deaminase RidA (YjgF/YER057c/UK114 family)
MATDNRVEIINPADWDQPRGYSNGLLMRGGSILFVAGQIGWDAKQQLVGDQFTAQFEQALSNVLAIVRAAGGDAHNIGKFTIYVTNKAEYIAEIKSVGAVYRKIIGKHFPAMALVEVSALLEDRAKVEIEAMAVI